jgi:hypothetical protein
LAIDGGEVNDVVRVRRAEDMYAAVELGEERAGGRVRLQRVEFFARRYQLHIRY